MTLKSISSFIASILLIGFTVSTGIIIYYFFTTFPRTQMQEVSGLSSKVLSCAGATFESKVKGCNLLNGLVLWLPMDEGSGNITYDLSGYGNNGTLYNGTNICSNPPTEGCPTWVDGVLGKALSFDGVNDKIIIPPSLLRLEEFTLIFWALGNNGTLPYPRVFSLGGGVSWSEHFAYQTDYTGNHYLRYVNETGIVNSVFTLFSVSPRFVASWSMFTMTVSISQKFVRAYTNLTLTKNFMFPYRPLPINLSFYAPYDGGVNMSIDEVLIYNRVLGEQEIQKLYYNYVENKFNITIGLLNNGFADLGNSFIAIVYLKNGTILQLPINFDNPLKKGYYFEYNLTVNGYYPSYGLIDKIIICSNDCQGVCSEVIVNNKC